MIVERTMSEGWLSNSYLVGDRAGGHAVIVDTGGPVRPILEAIETHELTVTHVLCTHHHADHVQHNADYARRFDAPVCGGQAEVDLFGGLDVELRHEDELVTGGLHVRALHTPGHTKGMLAFLVNEEQVFTGDTLFRGSVGGTRGAGHGTFEELRRSVMDILMALPPPTVVRPGHTDPTVIGEEWERNPFIRLWRGLDEPDGRRCTALGEPATLHLSARDYDGGTKCQVRFDVGGHVDVVPGSRITLG